MYNDFFVCKECYNRLPFLASYSQYQLKLQDETVRDAPLTTTSIDATAQNSTSIVQPLSTAVIQSIERPTIECKISAPAPGI